MSEFGDIVQGKCDAFADRVVKLNDYLLTQAANKEPGFKMGKEFTISLFLYTSNL